MSEDFKFGWVAGFLIGVLMTAGYSIYLRDRGRDECEAPLTRTQKCVQQWVPAPVDPIPTGGGQ